MTDHPSTKSELPPRESPIKRPGTKADEPPLTRDEFLTQANALVARATQRALGEGHLPGYSAVHNLIADINVLLARLADYIPAELPVPGAPPTPIVAAHRSPPAHPVVEPPGEEAPPA